MASQLNTSARYLSDLLKQETGKTALDHIHIYLIDEAKNLLLSSDNTIAETAYQLGFENPPYFTRLFKKEVGITPNEYRFKSMNLN
jgi:AraC-like DNA-binding protein